MVTKQTIQRFQIQVGGPVFLLECHAACPQCGALRGAKLLVGTSKGNSADEPGSIKRLKLASIGPCENCRRPKS